MGTNISKQSIKSLTSVVNESLMKVTTEIKNENLTNQSSHQTMSINMNGIRGCAGINATQEAEVTANVMAANSNEIATKMKADLMSSIKKEITNTLKQTNKDLNLLQTNIAVLDTESNSYIKNHLEFDIRTGITNTVSASQDGSQIMRFNIRNFECLDGGTLTFTQSMTMKVVAENISKNIVNNTIKAAVTNEIKEKLKQDVEQLNAGIDIFAIFTVLIIVICVVLGGYVFLRTGGVTRAVERNMDRMGKSTADKIDKFNPDDLKDMMASVNGGGRRSRAYNKSLKMKLVATSAVCVGLFYQGYYVREKKKIKDKYDPLLKL
jgi:sugar-specific transcriptional regulator TrmB